MRRIAPDNGWLLSDRQQDDERAEIVTRNDVASTSSSPTTNDGAPATEAAAVKAVVGLQTPARWSYAAHAAPAVSADTSSMGDPAQAPMGNRAMPEMRKADDGKWYMWEDFAQHYGATGAEAKWDAASLAVPNVKLPVHRQMQAPTITEQQRTVEAEPQARALPSAEELKAAIESQLEGGLSASVAAAPAGVPWLGVPWLVLPPPVPAIPVGLQTPARWSCAAPAAPALSVDTSPLVQDQHDRYKINIKRSTPCSSGLR